VIEVSTLAAGADVSRVGEGSDPSTPLTPLTGPPTDLRIDASEWQVFAATQANTLMIGEPLAVTRALNFVWTSLGRPVVWCDDSQLRLPTGPAGTYIIWRVDELTTGDQRQLLRWLDSCPSTRVLARSSRPVFPLVLAGTFTADLYYRLATALLLVP
jgi:hypothetical protein